MVEISPLISICFGFASCVLLPEVI